LGSRTRKVSLSGDQAFEILKESVVFLGFPRDRRGGSSEPEFKASGVLIYHDGCQYLLTVKHVAQCEDVTHYFRPDMEDSVAYRIPCERYRWIWNMRRKRGPALIPTGERATLEPRISQDAPEVGSKLSCSAYGPTHWKRLTDADKRRVLPEWAVASVIHTNVVPSQGDFMVDLSAEGGYSGAPLFAFEDETNIGWATVAGIVEGGSNRRPCTTGWSSHEISRLTRRRDFLKQHRALLQTIQQSS